MNRRRVSFDHEEGKTIAIGENESSPHPPLRSTNLQNKFHYIPPPNSDPRFLPLSDNSVFRASSVPATSPPLPPISKKVSDALNSAVSPSPSPSPILPPDSSFNFNPAIASAANAPPISPAQTLQKDLLSRKRAVKDFHFGRTLGEGSYSTVVEVTEISTDRVYAAKILDKRHIIKEKKTKYVTIERNVLHKLNHPFIINLHYTFQDTRSLCKFNFFCLPFLFPPLQLYSLIDFIIDLAENGELLNFVRKYGGLSEKCTQFYLAEIVLAVEYMHKNNVVHRDLKPENILLGSDMHILVTDFGTAKVLDDSTDKSSDLRTNSFVGTAEYVSPELLLNKSSGKSSDIWALGCIAYQLLSGRPPFKGANEYQTFQKILHSEYEFPPHFSSAAKSLIEKILVLDPKARLGCGPRGIDDIKQHEFFNGIDWNTLPQQQPPPMQGLLNRSKSDKSSAVDFNQTPYIDSSPPITNPFDESRSIDISRSPPKIPPKPKMLDIQLNVDEHINRPGDCTTPSSRTGSSTDDSSSPISPTHSGKNIAKHSLVKKYIENSKYDNVMARTDLEHSVSNDSGPAAALLLQNNIQRQFTSPPLTQSSPNYGAQPEISQVSAVGSNTGPDGSSNARLGSNGLPIPIHPSYRNIGYSDPGMAVDQSSTDVYSKSMRRSRPFRKKSNACYSLFNSCFCCNSTK
ncbi:3-phosphoinositide-dependent protein kinase 1 [Smittium mucronatum]|uniref:non-specific serine/threonine protein kinase n=1 Tax=Smittium mucronatum TaxID=133383 RepID=A0A1R0H1J6_9FUNG|nr:3-phosphoinositide-dependent protein kinase 1 [Smittium mucronatum]